MSHIWNIAKSQFFFLAITAVCYKLPTCDTKHFILGVLVPACPLPLCLRRCLNS